MSRFFESDNLDHRRQSDKFTPLARWEEWPELSSFAATSTLTVFVAALYGPSGVGRERVGNEVSAAVGCAVREARCP